ncbi:unnamed protein product [Urochloa humidicola]
MVLVKYESKYIGSQECEFYFVEEFMPNGNMEDAINGHRGIQWSSRFKMIQGIAEGLHYLHEQRVVHLDMKPANIPLDSDLNPRVSDFGIAKKLDHGDDEITRDNDSIAGTVGYIAPEYLSHGFLSTKCDVYGFGVTLLRTISCMCRSNRPDLDTLAEWIWKARSAIRMEELFDASLCDKSQMVQIKRCMEIGLLCIELDWKDRPSMGEVLAMLNGEKELPAPKQPAGVRSMPASPN